LWISSFPRDSGEQATLISINSFYHYFPIATVEEQHSHVAIALLSKVFYSYVSSRVSGDKKNRIHTLHLIGLRQAEQPTRNTARALISQVLVIAHYQFNEMKSLFVAVLLSIVRCCVSIIGESC